MTKRTLGILTGVIGSAVASWWWATQRGRRAAKRNLTAARDRGTVIFDNTPAAPSEGIS